MGTTIILTPVSPDTPIDPGTGDPYPPPNPIQYGPLGMQDGEYALDIKIGEGIHHLIRYHVNGADGNAIVDCGISGGRITVFVRYVGDAKSIKESAVSDKSTFVSYAVNITGDDGSTWYNCNLIPGGFSQIVKTTPTGRMSTDDSSYPQCFFDCSYTFQQDGVSS
jgi:hypothetical protein